MKKIVMLSNICILALITSPAFAQSSHFANNSGENIIRFTVSRGDSVLSETAYDPSEIISAVVIFNEDPLCLKIGGDGIKKLKEASRAVVQSYASQLGIQHAQFKRDFIVIEQKLSSDRHLNLFPGTAEILDAYVTVINGMSVRAARAVLDEIRNLPYVKGVYPDKFCKVYTETDDFKSIGRPVPAHIENDGHGIIIGIIDSGIDYNREDLGGGFGAGYKVIGGYDFVNRDSDPMDDNGHGTAVAGIAAANGISFKGVAPGAKLYALKAMNSGGSGSSIDIISAINYALDPNQDNNFDDAADVLNLSLGNLTGYSGDPMALAVDNAVKSGVVCIVAAGNDGDGNHYNNIGSPASSKEAICVGASESNNNIASFSSRGAANCGKYIKPEIAAPGVDLQAPLLGGQYSQFSGTSISAPYIAGCAALILEQHPDFKPEVVKSVITQNAEYLGDDYWTYGFGVINNPITEISAAATPATFDFGLLEPGSGTSSFVKQFTLYNFSNSAVNFSASLKPVNGVTANFSPQTFSVGANGSQIVYATFSISPSVLQNSDVMSDDWLPFSGEVRFDSGQKVYRCLYSFVISKYLKLDIKESSYTIIHDRISRSWNNEESGSPQRFGDLNTFLFPGGTYDIVSQFGIIIEGIYRAQYVVNENVNLSASVTKKISSSDAKNNFHYNWYDDSGRFWDFYPRQGFVLLLNKSANLGIKINTYRLCQSISDLSSNYRYEWYFVSDPNKKTFYVIKGEQNNGTSQDVYFSPGSDFKEMRFKYKVPSTISSLWLLNGYGYYGSSMIMYLYSFNDQILQSPLENTGYIMHDPSDDFMKFSNRGSGPELPILEARVPENPVNLDYPKSSLLYTAPWYRVNSSGTVSSYILWDNSRPVLSNIHNTVTYGLGPTHWYGKFENKADTILFKTNSYFGEPLYYYTDGTRQILLPLFANQYQDVSPLPELNYKLYNEQNSLVSTDLIKNINSSFKYSVEESDHRAKVPVAPGKYSIEIADENSTVNGLKGTAKIVATMDTRLTDKNPPNMTSFNIVAGNQYSDLLSSDLHGQVRFLVEDKESALSARLFYRKYNDSIWHEMTVSQSGGLYVSEIPNSLPADYISLRLLAIDQSGNQLEYIANPAFYNSSSGLKPARVTLASPAGRIVLPLKEVELVWNQAAQAEEYRLQVSNDSLFNSILADEPHITATKKTIGPLVNKQTYYWRVSAVNSFSNGDWSETRSFTTEFPLPSKPTLAFPENNVKLQDKSVTLQWNKTSDSDEYQLQLSSDSLFNNLIADESHLSILQKQISSLENKKRYFWRVAATNYFGSGDWSETRSFEIQLALPSRPELIYPTANLSKVDTSPSLKWKSVRNADKYLFELANKPDFSVLAIGDTAITDSVKKITGLYQGRLYYWRVRAANTSGYGEWSDTWNFSTLLPIPSNLTLQRTGLKEITLAWKSNSKDEDGFVIERKISGDSGFITVDSIASGVLKYKDSEITQGFTYVYRIAAYTEFLVSDFTRETSIVITASDGIDIPKEFSLSQNYPNPFNPTTTIKFSIPIFASPGVETLHTTSLRHIWLIVYDVLGREVATLVNENKSPGNYEVEFNGADLPSGIYIYVLRAGEFTATGKCTLIK